MALDIDQLDDSVMEFLTERHLATLTTLRTDGSPHVVAVGFSYDPEARVVRVITWALLLPTFQVLGPATTQ